MEKTSKIYMFLTSLFFLFAPFSLGIVGIYFESDALSDHLYGLIVNAVLIIIFGVVIFVLIKKDKLVYPNKVEIKYLVFGFVSNIVLYFYTFQESLNIERAMTIYLAMILILITYMFMIERKKFNYELWIIALLYFIIDLIHFEYLAASYGQAAPYEMWMFFTRLFYYSVPIATLTLFIIKIVKYNIIDQFTIIFIIITSLMTLIFVEAIEPDSKLILTIMFIAPFVITVDFIVSIIYKKFNPNKIVFYLRMSTIILMILAYRGLDYFTMSTYKNHDFFELIALVYVVIIANIIEYLIPNKEIIED